jgi:hypothetical protein
VRSFTIVVGVASVCRDRVVAEGHAQAVSVLIVNQLVRRVHLDPSKTV